MKQIFTTLLLFNSLFCQSVLIEQMTLEEKVGQLFVAYFDGEEVNEHAKKLIEEMKIGGIIYYRFSNGLSDPIQVQRLSNGLQTLSKQTTGIPLFIAIDQEGGAVCPLKNGFTEFPGNRALGKTKDPKLAYLASLYTAQELKAVGINFNLAPVVDINNNPKNPVIGIRSFGEEKEQVSKFGKACLKGFEKGGVICCLKHFPGHGDVTKDSHFSLPIVDKGMEELNQQELYPFKKLAPYSQAIMTAHLLLPQIDPQNPATLSPAILQGILRNTLHFDGIIITDSLIMDGVMAGCKSRNEVAIKAFLAGNDLLLIGGRALSQKVDGETNIQEILELYHSILTAVKEGVISNERLNLSVARILKLKKEASLFDAPAPTLEDIEKTVQKKEHQAIALEIAKRSIEIKKWDNSFSFSQKKVAVIAPKILQESLIKSKLLTLSEKTLFFDQLNPTTEEKFQILAACKDCDGVLFCSYNGWIWKEQLDLLKDLAKTYPTCWIATRDDHDFKENLVTAIQIATFSPTTPSLYAAYLKFFDDPKNFGSCCAQTLAK
jgi:beta-N-acetylhexosaminidase